MTLVALVTLTGHALVYAHGGVPIDQDKCVFRLAGKRIHFTAYQPRRSGNEITAKTLCRKLPETTGTTYFALDLVDDPLRKRPLEVDITPVGHGDGGIRTAPIVDLEVASSPQGVVTFKHDFNGATGRYRLEVFNATDHSQGNFEFEVGVRESQWEQQYGSRLISTGFVAVLVLLGYRSWRRRKTNAT